jgi:hypothetical protein
MLSRSVQRASAVRRWTGWPVRPAVAWGLSLVFAVAVATGGLLWYLRYPDTSVTVSNDPVNTTMEGSFSIETGFVDWSQPDPFDELVILEEQEQEALRLMLTAEQGTIEQQ